MCKVASNYFRDRPLNDTDDFMNLTIEMLNIFKKSNHIEA
jgi:hypothetical protein